MRIVFKINMPLLRSWNIDPISISIKIPLLRSWMHIKISRKLKSLFPELDSITDFHFY